MKRLLCGLFPGTPDLIVEVLSPTDSSDFIHEKMARYFAHGTCRAWVINPAERNSPVNRAPETDRLLRVIDTLDGGGRAPGFQLPLAELFAELSFE